MRLLEAINNAVEKTTTHAELYTNFVKSVADELAFSRVFLAIESEDHLSIGAAHGYENNLVLSDQLINKEIVNRGFSTGQPIVIDNVEQRRSEWAFSHDTVSIALLPVHYDSSVVGLLVVETSNHELSKEDLAILSKATKRLDLKIENVELHRRTRADLNRAQALYEISHSIQDAKNIESMLDEIVRSIRRAVSARWAIIYKFDYANKVVEHVSKTEYDSTPLDALNFEQLVTGLTGWTIENKEVVLSNDVSDDIRENQYVKKYKVSSGSIRSSIVAPLFDRGLPIGCIAVVNSDYDPFFTEEDREMISIVASQSAAAITQHQLLRRIEYQAFHDSITRLPNRAMLDDCLKNAITQSGARQLLASVVFIDLDGFKNVNDTLGHSFGDKLLVQVSRRLQSGLRNSDILLRIGGDEFALVLTCIESRQQAHDISVRALESLQSPIELGDHTIQIGASIGVSIYPDDATDAGPLLAYADSAMYQAKWSGKNDVRMFVPEFAAQAKDRMDMEIDLRNAIANDEMFLEYQPQINIENNQLFGVEALLRWQHPKKGRIPPDKFIPVAEDCNLINSIGMWVLEQACELSVKWHNLGISSVKIAVNISAKQFEKDDFVDLVKQAIIDSKMQINNLEFEVTETIVMTNLTLVAEKLRELQKLGIAIAIDDFGTGYSSLLYLQKLPLDSLKIDRSFIISLLETPENKAIIEAIIVLAQRFGLRTVAEGVESISHLEYLKTLGCDIAQGYYLDKPLHISDLEQKYLYVEVQTSSDTLL